MSAVVGMGYLIIEARDLNSWRTFGEDLLGLRAAVTGPERLRFRLDERSYRIEVRKAQADTVTCIGWEVKGETELAQVGERATKAGYAVSRGTAEEVEERGVTDLLSLADPSGLRLELFWGPGVTEQKFVSPTGARFITGDNGLGHVFQFVDDERAHYELYRDVFGFGLSDFIEFGPQQAGYFMHCNARHHSYAFAKVARASTGVGHFMVEVDDIDQVGRAHDQVLAGAAPLASSFGRHTNDEMLSFYARTPSGFQVEYGYGGRFINPTNHRPVRWKKPSRWGHVRTDPNEPDV